MSDPVSNTEIEDVLSSIRQLISQSNAQHRRGVADRPEKLILTPALRVDDGAPSDHVKPPASSETTPVAKAASEVTQDTAAPKEPGEIPAPKTQADAGAKKTENGPLPFFSRRAYAANPSGDLSATDTGRSQKTGSDPDAHSASAAPIEKSIDHSSDQWEPDGGDDTEQSDFLSFHAARMQSDHEGIVGENKAQVWRRRPSQAPVIAQQDSPIAEIDPPKNDDHSSLVASSSVEIVGADTDIIDEEVVRAMVARLVREELQGEVGEKITRSIRRFIRREIERAITLKELQ